MTRRSSSFSGESGIDIRKAHLVQQVFHSNSIIVSPRQVDSLILIMEALDSDFSYAESWLNSRAARSVYLLRPGMGVPLHSTSKYGGPPRPRLTQRNPCHEFTQGRTLEREVPAFLAQTTKSQTLVVTIHPGFWSQSPRKPR